MQEYHLRGAQVALVSGDDVVLAAEGVRNVAGDPLDVDTVYPIGSTTKAFTAAAVGICVDRGLLAWDDPVHKYIPGFSLFDEYAGAHLTLRDALCHRSGLTRHEFSWMGAPFDTEELIRRLRFLPPGYEFRTEFRYSNQMYALLGAVISRASGESYAEFLRENITGPLGMGRTSFSVNDIPAFGNFATPYMQTPSGIQDLPLFNIDNIGGAGFINSTARDIAHWLDLQLRMGKAGDRQIISEKNLAETRNPQMVARSNFLNTPDFNSRTYGMGWYVENYRGVSQVRHTGGINGFFSQAAVIPSKGLAVMVMINTLAEDACTPLLFEIIDRAAGYEPRDWAAYERMAQAAFKQGMSALGGRILALKNPSLQPTRPLADFSGEYEHKGYGRVSISLNENHLTLRYHIYQMELEHLNYDSFYFLYQGFPVPVRFLTSVIGKISQVLINIDHELLQPIPFDRVS
jgi:CubicO group peptidase (beta-lactamase class C family)